MAVSPTTSRSSRDIVGRGLSFSPIHEVLIEESVIGWKEFELEVMRDAADNFVVICSIENIDPDGRAHRRQHHRRAGADAHRQGISAHARRRAPHHPPRRRRDGRLEHPVRDQPGRWPDGRDRDEPARVALQSRWPRRRPGFPIAKIAAKLALGYLLHEIPNDITRVTPASFEPTIDYVVVKIPRWNFEKFPQADRTLTTQMKSVGEAMAIGRTFKEAFLKGIRSLELGRAGLLFTRPTPDHDDGGSAVDEEEDAALRRELIVPNDRRMWALFRALDKAWPLEQLHELTKIDPWFLEQFAELVELRRTAEMIGLRDMSRDLLRTLKRAGFGDQELGQILRIGRSRPCARSAGEHKLTASFKRIDTCAAEFESFTPYLYSSYEDTCEADPTDGPRSSFLAAAPTASGRASSSTIAAAMPCSASAGKASRRSW